MRNSKRTNAALWSAVMAVGACGLVSQARGQTTSNYTFDTTDSAQVGVNTNYYITYPDNYIDMYGSGDSEGSFAAMDFNSGGTDTNNGTLSGPLVTAVSPNFTVTLFDEGYSKESTTPVTYNFFLVTDTTTSLENNATDPGTISWQANGTVGNGLAASGSTGGFAANSSIYYLGSGTFTSTDSGSTTEENFNVSLTNASEATTTPTPIPQGYSGGLSTNVTAAEEYVLAQLQKGGDVRVLVTTDNTAATYQSIDVNNAADGGSVDAEPQLTLSVTSATATANNSTIALTTVPPGGGNSNTNATVTLSYPRVVESYADTATLSVTASNAQALVLAEPDGMDGSLPPPGSSNPIASGGTGTVTVGFSDSDTAQYTPGYTATGSVQFVDANHTGSTITISSSALVVDQRDISDGNTTSAISAGNILVGATATVSNLTLSTIPNANLPEDNDEGPDVLTTETLTSGATAAPYTVKDPFTDASVGTLNATSTSTFVFDSATPDTNAASASVTPAISGVYGDDHSETIGNETETFKGYYAGFDDTNGMSNDGTTAGEDDYANIYLQWVGYQAASVTANATSNSPLSVTPNSSAPVSLTNAASNDNVVTENGTTTNDGLRDSADITGTTAFNQTWTLGGWSVASGLTNGTVISGSKELYDNNSYSDIGSISFTQSSQMLNGIYGSSMQVDLANGLTGINNQTIDGASADTLAPVTIYVQSDVTSNPSVESGAYTLNGGTLSAPATDLTGSFSQTGGTSTFASIGGSGTVTVSGGSLTVTSGFTGSDALNVAGGTATLATGSGGSTLSSLTISAGGSLNITNNHLIISDPGGSIDSTIEGYLANGYNGGGWNGTSAAGAIVTTASTGTLYGIGWADGAVGGISGIGSGQLEIKYTLYGDTNLDGVVTGVDFGNLAANFGKSGPTIGWAQGAFTYNNSVTGVDFGLLAGNFGKSLGSAGDVVTAADWAALDAFAEANGLMSYVPEPASIGVLAISGAFMLGRRRRRRTT